VISPKQAVQQLIDRGMTQSEIATLIGIHQASISKLLNDRQATVTHEKWSRLQVLVKTQQKTRPVS
jgi:predicted transcriptional regulator